MAWTAPMTAVANQIWTAAQFNTHVRDNLNETGVAKVSGSGKWAVATGANALTERTMGSTNTVATTETTSSTTYTDLTTTGPSLTLTTGTKCLVLGTSRMGNTSTNAAAVISYEISGATTLAASDTWAAFVRGTGNELQSRWGFADYVTVTAGSNTFKMKYRVSSGTGSFQDRELIVVMF